MHKFLSLAACAVLPTNVLAGITQQSAGGGARVTLNRAITLGGGSDTAGMAWSESNLNFSRSNFDRAVVGPDFVDVSSAFVGTGDAWSTQVRLDWAVDGELEDPVAADFSQVFLDFGFTVIGEFDLASSQTVSFSTRGTGLVALEAAIFSSDPDPVLTVPSGSDVSFVLGAGHYRYLFLAQAPNGWITGQGPLSDRNGFASMTLVLPLPGTLPVMCFGSLMILRRSRSGYAIST
jgi:hypothetical protein